MQVVRSIFILPLLLCLVVSTNGCRDKDRSTQNQIVLPERGLCAHRGAMATHPENTISAFRAAIEAGAHMIEFDVQLTSDNQLVVIHDATVDRTTNGTGKVAELTFPEIRELDAGSWKSPEFKGELIPSLNEALEIMPDNIWLNIHLKGDDILGQLVAKVVEQENRLHQAFLACGADAAGKARSVVPDIMICNMDRKEENWDYVNGTIDMEADFIQLRRTIYPEFSEYIRLLHENGVRVNYFGTDDPDEIRMLFDYGVDFPLVDDIVGSIDVATELGIKPVKPN